MKNSILLITIIISLILVSCSDNKATNPSNNSSTTVTIGKQIWMTKNLNVDHYRNGDSIPEVRDLRKWDTLTSGAWSYYENSDSLGNIYGKFYNWFAVNDPRGLSPVGFHIPSVNEWDTLIIFLGGENIAAGKLKEAGTSHWNSPNKGANESGFTSLPGGIRFGCGTYGDVGNGSFYWSSTDTNAMYAWGWYLSSKYNIIGKEYYAKVYGFSVRCVKD